MHTFRGLLSAVLSLISLTLAAKLSTFPSPSQECRTAQDECDSYNGLISEQVIVLPWTVSCLAALVLGLPTVLVERGGRLRGIQVLFFFFLEAFVFVNVGKATRSKTVAYAICVYSAVRALFCLNTGDHLVGGKGWWGLRHPVAVVILVGACLRGPPVSVVEWDGLPPLYCSLQAHVFGLLLPAAMGFLLDGISDVVWAAGAAQ